MTVEIGNTTKGVVVKLLEYGAIVRLDGGEAGLVHISEITDSYVQDIRDYLAEDEEVSVKVLRLNPKGKYELSLKQANPQPVKREERPVAVAASHPQRRTVPAASLENRPPPPVTFEDKLSRFMKESDQRQGDLKRNIEGKRRRR